MHPRTILQDPSGRSHELIPGDMIGRLWSAALQIDDGRVSEAHAMVSLREGELVMLPLRGAIAVDGRPVAQVVLEPGLRVQLAAGGQDAPCFQRNGIGRQQVHEAERQVRPLSMKIASDVPA